MPIDVHARGFEPEPTVCARIERRLRLGTGLGGVGLRIAIHKRMPGAQLRTGGTQT